MKKSHAAAPLSLTPSQKIFLAKAAKIVDANLNDSAFTVETFSREIHLSRSQLFRRIKAATGGSVCEFIRSRRLNYALRLMGQGISPLGRVAKKAGFGDVCYFRRCFKKEFGVTPSGYWKKSTINFPEKARAKSTLIPIHTGEYANDDKN